MIGAIVIINWHPVINALWIPRLGVIVRVKITQEIPTGAGIAIQCVRFASAFMPIVTRGLWLSNRRGFTRLDVNPHAHPIINLR